MQASEVTDGCMFPILQHMTVNYALMPRGDCSAAPAELADPLNPAILIIPHSHGPSALICLCSTQM